MRRDLIFYGAGLLGLTWLVALWAPETSISQKAQRQPPPRLAPEPLSEPIAPDPGLCQAWDFRLIPGASLAPELEEMSGLVWSTTWKDRLYHISDSGNRPDLLLTDEQGFLEGSIPYAQRQSDTEDISRGPCPWPAAKGAAAPGSCLFVADMGDNFRLRSENRLHIVEEASLHSNAPRRESLVFNYPERQRFDAEALAVHPSSGTIHIFTKEKGKSQVFELRPLLGAGSLTPTLIATLPITHVTGASYHPSGERLLLLNYQGASELSHKALAGFQQEPRSWFPYRRKIPLLQLGQQEAIAYAPSGLSFIYSGERRGFSKKLWGLVRARCRQPADDSFSP